MTDGTSAIRSEDGRRAPPQDRARRNDRGGGALARRGLACACQCELVGRGLGLCRVPVVRPGCRKSATGCCSSRPRRWVPKCRISRPCAACRACVSKSGDDRTVRVWTAFQLAGRRPMPWTGRPLRKRSRRARSRRGISTCTPITSTATTAAMRRSGWCRAHRILGRAIAMPDVPWLGLDGVAGRDRRTPPRQAESADDPAPCS